MTVAELLRYLKAYDKTLQVYIQDSEMGRLVPVGGLALTK
jgi:hypothetical protein